MPDFRVRKVVLLGSIVLVIVAHIIFFFCVRHFISTWTERGQVGDLFGVTNSLFSGLAFAFLIYTILLQQAQLNIQRAANEDVKEQAVIEKDSRDQDRNLELLTFLVRFYDDELRRLSSSRVTGPAGALLDTRIGDMRDKRVQLETIILSLHRNVVTVLGER